MTQPSAASRAARQHRHAGRREHPGRARAPPPAGDDPLDQRRLEPAARLARVAADHDAAPRAGEAGGRRSQLAGQVGRQIDAGDAADAVGAEQLALTLRRGV